MSMRQEPTQSTSEPLPVVGEFSARSGLTVYLGVTFGLAWVIELGPVRMLGLKSGAAVVLLMDRGHGRGVGHASAGRTFSRPPRSKSMSQSPSVTRTGTPSRAQLSTCGCSRG